MVVYRMNPLRMGVTTHDPIVVYINASGRNVMPSEIEPPDEEGYYGFDVRRGWVFYGADPSFQGPGRLYVFYDTNGKRIKYPTGGIQIFDKAYQAAFYALYTTGY